MISSSLIGLCMGLQAPYANPCAKAFESALIQSGVNYKFAQLENIANRSAMSTATYLFGEQTIRIAGTTVSIIKVVRDRQVNVRLPKIGVFDSQASVGPDLFSLRLQWAF